MKNVLYTKVLILISTVNLYAQGTLSDSLQLYFRFDGNVTDYSPNQINATVNGASLTTNRFNIVDAAYYFDGFDDYIICDPTDTILNQDFDSLTISVWIYPEAGAVSASFGSRIINTRGRGPIENGNSGYQVKLADNTGTSKWGLFDSHIEGQNGEYSQCLFCGNPYDYDAWYHLVMVFKPDTLTFYIDNVIDSEIRISNPLEDISNSLPTIIGASAALNGVFGVFGQFFKGKIDDVRIYNKALSMDEVSELYTTNDDEVIVSIEDELNSQRGIDVYPNPFVGHINVSGFDKSTYKILTLEGRIVKQGILSAERINLVDLTPGTYILSVTSKSIISTIKIIKD